MPVEVGIALPEESVSWTMLSVPWGMKQDSADRPPRYLPAPPESVISFLYKNKTGKLCSVCSTFGSLQIGVRARADRAADRVDQQVAVALAPLIDAAEDGRRPLAGAADAHQVAPQLGIGVEHLREHVIGRVERDLHALHRRRRHGSGEVRAVERAGRRVELDMAQGAADRVVLLPAHQLVQRHHDRATPAGVGGIDGAGLGVGAFVLEYQTILLLP